MLLLWVAAACVLAGGLWLVAAAVWPAQPHLPSLIAQLHTPGRPRREVAVEVTGSTASKVGRWWLRRFQSAAMLDDRTAADLAVVRRPIEMHAGTTALTALGFGVATPIVWTVAATLAGVSLPLLVPVWVTVVAAALGWFTPLAVLRAQAAEARKDFRHALGAYLDILVLLLSAQEGPESAMDIAARSGTGTAFDELRRSIHQARLSGDPVWDALDNLGRRVDVIELREIAAAGALAGESGAAVRRSLVAKARALRSSALAAAETSARQRTQAMFAPLVLMGLGFILFLVYPLLTNMTIGGT